MFSGKTNVTLIGCHVRSMQRGIPTDRTNCGGRQHNIDTIEDLVLSRQYFQVKLFIHQKLGCTFCRN